MLWPPLRVRFLYGTQYFNTSRANSLFILIKTIVFSLEECADPTTSSQAAISRLNLSGSEHLVQQSGHSTVVDNVVVSDGKISHRFVDGQRPNPYSLTTTAPAMVTLGLRTHHNPPAPSFSSTIMSFCVL